MNFPLFILPFDHRSGFAKELLHTTYPLDEASTAKAIALKKIIWEAFLLAKAESTTDGTLAILVDEELGSEIIADAQAKNVPVIVSTEKSGVDSFDFIHGADFGKALTQIEPTFAKALVHYKLGDEPKNTEQRARLKKLADFCVSADIPLMLEILTGVKGSDPSPVANALIELEETGIMPAIWKLEGFESRAAWTALARVTEIPMVVLGRGESTEEVELWTREAAASGVVKGFAIGRTIFLQPLLDLVAGKIDEQTAKGHIAENYLHFIDVWETNV